MESSVTGSTRTPNGSNTDLVALEERLGYTFEDRSLLVRALTHRSFANEAGTGSGDNEVLEFLGDAVLGLVVSDVLCARHPRLSEGEMSKLKSHLVSAETLTRFAEEMELGRFVLLGRGEEKTDGRQKSSILANALEAVIAALYTDGGLECARNFVLSCIEPLLGPVQEGGRHPVRDFKSALQEHVQGAGLPLPRYRVVEEEGPDHEKVFHVRVRVSEGCVATGHGRTKKRAEQRAARQVLERLRIQEAGPATPPTD